MTTFIRLNIIQALFCNQHVEIGHYAFYANIAKSVDLSTLKCLNINCVRNNFMKPANINDYDEFLSITEILHLSFTYPNDYDFLPFYL